MGLSGCTSKKATDEETPADVAEVADDGLEAAGDEVTASDEAAELGGDELSADEQLPDESATASTDEAAPADGAAGDDFATPAEELSDNPEKTDDMGDEFAANEPAPEPMAEPTPEPTPEPMSEPPPASVDESLAAGGASEPMPMSDEPKPTAKLRKIADAPYEQGGVLVNAVYVARKGDDLDGVATKIYGSPERKKEIVKLNPMIKGRGVKVGDKIYYNSPQRPTDNSKLLTYYEDMGLAPETYAVTKPENIRDIAKNLLGDTNSWKELWATNLDIESKGELAEGTQLRYWAGTAAAAPTMAQNDAPPADQAAPPIDPSAAAPVDNSPPPPPPMEQPPVDQQAMNTPPPDQAAPPPVTDEMSAPPPPPPADLPPPPPPVDTAAQQPPPDQQGNGDASGVMGALENPDQTMAMGVGAIVLLGAVAIFIMIRKRKARRQIDFHTSTQTQIE